MEALSLQLKRIDNRLGKIESRTKQHGGPQNRATYILLLNRPIKLGLTSKPTVDGRPTVTVDGPQTVDGPPTGADLLVTSVLPVQHNTTQTGHPCADIVMAIIARLIVQLTGAYLNVKRPPSKKTRCWVTTCSSLIHWWTHHYCTRRHRSISFINGF